MIFVHFELFSKEPDIAYTSRDEQGQLLQQVLAAGDQEADEEKLPGEYSAPSGSGGVVRKSAGSLSHLSGGNDAFYMEYKKPVVRHPLFKKFR